MAHSGAARRRSRTVGGGVRTVLSAPFAPRAWAEVAYCLVGFPLGVAGFLVLGILLALGSALAVSIVGTAVGVLLLVVGLGLARALGAIHRWLATWLGERVPAPPRTLSGRGFLGRLDARLRDGTAWRSAVYVLAKLPVSALGAYALTWWFTGLVNLSAPLRWGLFGQQPGAADPDGAPVITPLSFGGSLDIGTFAGTFVAAAFGVGTLLLAPWVTRAVTSVDRWLIRALLSPGALAQRVRDLEETRAFAVDDAAALLRRVERDLHDGAQVKLVALAMSLDMALERLGGDVDPADAARIRQLVDSAHHNATDVLADLRDLARGIHPPVLDEGLPDALATLAARSAVPVDLSVDTPERPTAAIETIAYFCAAELLANVIKHSGARRAEITAVQHDGVLRLRVSDDGRGGARVGAGSGLTGLMHRIRAVDGTLDIDSPTGGPSVITVELPLHA